MRRAHCRSAERSRRRAQRFDAKQRAAISAARAPFLALVLRARESMGRLKAVNWSEIVLYHSAACFSSLLSQSKLPRRQRGAKTVRVASPAIRDNLASLAVGGVAGTAPGLPPHLGSLSLTTARLAARATRRA